MKKIYFIVSLAFITLTSQAQQDVYLKINHQLGAANFAFNQTASNNLSNSFNLQRLEYYISSIELKYDGGQDTLLTDLYVLVDAGQTTKQFLGTFNFTNLESITFAVGVDTAANHDDPASFPVNHPLYPKSPSMHWGWAAGYRFVALEGMTGTNMNDIFQIHALGDGNYLKQTLVTTGQSVGNDLNININADYTQALKNITINSNLLTHGETGEAATLLTNFSNSVFSNGLVGIDELSRANFKMYPNPSQGDVYFDFDEKLNNSQLIITDVNSRKMTEKQLILGHSNRISIEKAGIYFANFYRNNQLIGSRKIIIQ